MRIANLAGRAALVVEGQPVDVHTASGGAFGPTADAVFERWAEFRAWAEGHLADHGGAADAFDTDSPWLFDEEIGAPSPRPRQVFAVGLNYVEHALEAGFDLPDTPVVFTKFPTSVTGPNQTIAVPRGSVDWEVELVAIIGVHAYEIDVPQAAAVVAGLTLGQDLSERQLQHTGPAPQFALAKSFPGFGPTGPVMATLEEFADADDIGLGCRLNGELMQEGRSSGMVFSLGEIVSWLSHITPLCPGDVIFFGTPSGIGASRTPQRFLGPGDELVSWMEGIGEMRTTIVGPALSGPGVPASTARRHAESLQGA